MTDDIDSTADPIYQELLAIGSKDKTMRADALIKYKHLLKTSEVRRRARGSTDEATLAWCAHDALRDAIKQIVEPSNKEVAEAALCFDGLFEGLEIKVRIHRMPKVSEKQFKYRREKAFEEIIEYLKRTVTTSAWKPVTLDAAFLVSNPDNEPELRRWMAQFCSDVAKLHYAALGMMFAFHLDAELQAHSFSGDYRQVPLIDYLFRAYTHVVHAWRFTRTAFMWLKMDEPDDDHDGNLLHGFWEGLASYGPLALARITAEEREILGRYALANEMELEARKLYREHWYEIRSDEQAKDGASKTMLFPDMATSLAAQSGAFLLVMSRKFEFTIPIHAHARRLAHKALASYYEFDEWRPLMNGLSLRDRADAFFDAESIRLADKAVNDIITASN